MPIKQVLTWILSLDTSRLIIAAMILGIMAGIFFGESVTRIEIVGIAFIRLIQMTIIPFVVVALIRGFGSFTIEAARDLGKHAIVAFAVIWFLTLFVCFMMQLSFPSLANASFFSSSLIHQPASGSGIEQFIPANPFSAIANSTVPAIVVFSVCLGIALISSNNKAVILDSLTVLEDALGKLTGAIFRLAPIGIFALTASTAGTVSIAELSKMQVYYYSFYMSGFIICIIALPLFLSTFLPFTYKQIFNAAKGSLILAFTSGSSFIVIPLLAKDIRALFENVESVSNDKIDDATALIPISFNFPHVGKVLYLIFILFIAWFYDKDLSLAQQGSLGLFTILNFFGEAEIALPALLDQAQLPVDAFNLYLTSMVITTNMETGSNAMSMFSFTVLYIGLSTGIATFSIKKLLLIAAKIAGVTVVSVFGLSLLMQAVVSESTEQRELLMDFSLTTEQESTTHRSRSGLVRQPERTRDLMASIMETRKLKVGYLPDSMPFAYFNGEDALVGFDIEFAHALAKSLEAEIEFIPFSYESIAEDLDTGLYDIAMSSVTITSQRLRKVDFSDSYLTLHLAFVVRDHVRKQFESVEKITAKESLKIAVLKGSAFKAVIEEKYPNAEIVELSDRRQFFIEEVADALIMTAEQGSAWTLLYPDFLVSLPDGSSDFDFIAYPVAKNNLPFLYYVNQQLKIYKAANQHDSSYQRWVLGNDEGFRKKRWSVMDNIILAD